MKTKTLLLAACVFNTLISVGQNLEIKEISSIPTENPQTNPKEEIYTMVEEMPEFPGGTMEMMKFIKKNSVYPKSAKEKGISGKCFVKFTVNADGTISDITVLKGVANCKECDDEAVRVIKLMPTWKPAKQSGKAVPIYYNLPFNFSM